MLLRVCVSVSEKDCKVRKRERDKKKREGRKYIACISYHFCCCYAVVAPWCCKYKHKHEIKIKN